MKVEAVFSAEEHERLRMLARYNNMDAGEALKKAVLDKAARLPDFERRLFDQLVVMDRRLIALARDRSLEFDFGEDLKRLIDVLWKYVEKKHGG